MSDSLRYPIGRFERLPALDATALQAALADLAELPQHLEAAVNGLDETQLDTPYRDGGWTVRQVVHHVADSHLNAYVRMKLVATEDAPVLRVYDEQAWAEVPDARNGPIDLSLPLISALHTRWTTWLWTVDPATRARIAHHPESGDLTLDVLIQIYAWHSRHHVAHITRLRERKGW